MRTHFRNCYFCQANCGVEIQIDDDDTIISIRGDKQNTFSDGFICPKATYMKYLQEDPDRLRKPMIKQNGEWQPITFDAAIDQFIEQIQTIKEKYGPKSVGIYLGMGAMMQSGWMTHINYLFEKLGDYQLFTASSTDTLPLMLASKVAFGGDYPVPDIPYVDYFIVSGGNPAVSNSSMFSAPNMKARIKEIKQRGGEVVVIDPRRTETAKIASQHVPVIPGSDAALMLAMIHVVINNPMPNLPDYVTGIEELREAVSDFGPEVVADCCGVAPDVIREMAEKLRDAERAVMYGRLGTCIQEYGALTSWLILIINVLCGNMNVKGGNLFSPALVGPAMAERVPFFLGQLGDKHSRVRGLPSFANELPVAVLAEEMTTPGDGQIKALVTLGGNPVLTTPNGTNLEKALEQLDFYVAFDIYINETTRFADMVIPNATPLEVDAYPILSKSKPFKRHLQYSPAAVAKPEGMLEDWELVKKIHHAFCDAEGAAPEPIRSSREIVDELLKTGREQIGVDELLKHPHGLDLGELEPMPDADYRQYLALPQGLDPNANCLVDCGAKLMLDDIPRVKAGLLEAEGNSNQKLRQIKLIHRRDLRSIGSFIHNSDKAMSGTSRSYLEIHPDDLARLGAKDEDEVEVASSAAAIRVHVKASEDVRPGVVCLPYGFGHGRHGSRLSVANKAENRGVSVNDLTDHHVVDQLSGTSATCGIPVEVRLLPSSVSRRQTA